MMSWRIEEAHHTHLTPIAMSMRDADKKEVWSSHRYTPAKALEVSFMTSVYAWTCIIDEEPAFMWGVSRCGSIFSEKGIPWLLGTDKIYGVTRDFIKHSRPFIEKMHEYFPYLENYVHASNTVSIRWLTWCGFTIENAPIILNNEKFYRFWRISLCANQ